MKRWVVLLAPVLAFLLLLPGQNACAASRRQVLPQVVDVPLNFQRPLPASRPVSADWFSDAIFIGDTRLAELTASGLFQPGLSLAQNGLNLRSLRSGEFFSQNGQRTSLSEMLEGSSLRKVYLMLGFNDAGWMTEEDFYKEYAALIDDLRTILPGAKIYLQTLIPVTVSRSAVQTPNNDLLARRSALILMLAREKRTYLVTVDSCLMDANGALASGLSTDGLHLTGEGNALWFQYLQTHTMGN